MVMWLVIADTRGSWAVYCATEQQAKIHAICLAILAAAATSTTATTASSAATATSPAAGCATTTAATAATTGRRWAIAMLPRLRHEGKFAGRDRRQPEQRGR